MRWLVWAIYLGIVALVVLATGGFHGQMTHAQKIVMPIVGFLGASLWRGMKRAG